MLAWALRFIDEFAPDILHALQVRDQLLAPAERGGSTSSTSRERWGSGGLSCATRNYGPTSTPRSPRLG
jgi:hypothetical protein